MRPLLKHLALTLADRQAVSTIIDGCEPVVIGGIVWRDTTKLRNVSSVVWECKYLHMRGFLARHSELQHLVKIRGFDHEKK